MSVDLPAPFSPSRAWTWPHSTARSTPSLALNSPKVLTIPRSSRAELIRFLVRDSGLDRARLQLGGDVGHLRLDIGRDLAVEVVVRSQPDAVVLDGEALDAGDVGALDHPGDGLLDGQVEVLLGAGDQAAVDVRVADELVHVDADAELVGLLGRKQGAVAGLATRPEEDVSPLADEGLALLLAP